MTEKPCSSANAVFLPTKSGLSPSTWRRSEAREHPRAAGFAEHGRGNLAGESPGFGGVHILRADEDAGGPVEAFPRGFQSGERREHDDIPIVRRAAKDRGEFVRGGFGFRAGFVHLPVGGR